MTTMDYHEVTGALPAPHAPGLLGRLKAWLQRRRQQRRVRISMLELGRLDERLLRDIGLSQGDIRDALRGRRSSVWLDPIRRSRSD